MGRRTVIREVRSGDPSLTPEANRLLTGELRAAVGDDRVEVEEAAPERSGDAHATHSGAVATLIANRLVLVIGLLVLLTIGIVVSLATGSWWALVVALGIHAVGTLVTAASAIQLTTEVEHVDPAVAARLEEEGVGDPDKLLSDLVEDYAGATHAHGTAEVISTGNNDNRADPVDEPARAATEQRTSLTPSARASSPAGSGSVIGAMPLAIVGGLVVLTLVIGAVDGGVMWAVPALVWACAAGWMATVLAIDGRADERAARAGESLSSAGPEQPADDARTGLWRRVLPVIAVVVAGIVGFAILVDLLASSV